MSTARDLALDANYDLAIQGQDLAPLLTDVDSISSDIKATILLVSGEWFLDTSQGIPWFDLFQSKGAPVNRLRSLLVTAVGARLGVIQVLNLSISVNSPARTASVSFTVQTDAGLLTSTVQVSP